MLGERVRVTRRPESVQELRRPLDVGEQERDRPGREVLRADAVSIAPLRGASWPAAGEDSLPGSSSTGARYPPCNRLARRASRAPCPRLARSRSATGPRPLTRSLPRRPYREGVLSGKDAGRTRRAVSELSADCEIERGPARSRRGCHEPRSRAGRSTAGLGYGRPDRCTAPGARSAVAHAWVWLSTREAPSANEAKWQRPISNESRLGSEGPVRPARDWSALPRQTSWSPKVRGWSEG